MDQKLIILILERRKHHMFHSENRMASLALPEQVDIPQFYSSEKQFSTFLNKFSLISLTSWRCLSPPKTSMSPLKFTLHDRNTSVRSPSLKFKFKLTSPVQPVQPARHSIPQGQPWINGFSAEKNLCAIYGTYYLCTWRHLDCNLKCMKKYHHTK